MKTYKFFFIFSIVFILGCSPKYQGVFGDKYIFTYLELSKNGNCYYQSGSGHGSSSYSYGKYSFKNDSLILDFDDWKWNFPDSIFHYSACSTDSVYFNIIDKSDRYLQYRMDIYLDDIRGRASLFRDNSSILYPSDSLQYSAPFDTTLLTINASNWVGLQKIIDKPGCYTIDFYSPYPAISKIGYKKLSFKVVELKKDTIEIVYYYGHMYVGNRKLMRLSDEESKRFLRWKPLKE